ncbi:MAG TPA: BatA and WFA domain-containing protein [Pirellulales bacterium]|nr:BatA and WFA domain-containing protein [Pirellulales bacterium]
MDFLPALSAWQWALLLAVPPAIVALYFLKLRRQPLEVPSTYLWHKSVEDLHVNSLWQRIRQNLLLYLQLLLVLLVIFALLRPGWRSGMLSGGRYILLIDHSASMNATDVNPSRLDEAKRQALAMIDEMPSGEQAMVISFSDVARVEQGWTDVRRELSQAVNNIRPTHRSTSIEEALRVAAGLANPTHTTDENQKEIMPAKEFIFSDGKFPPATDVAPGHLELVYVPIGKTSAENVGIVAFSVRRNEDRENELEAFGSLQNFGAAEVAAPVDLLLNGNVIDASTVHVKPGETAGVSFHLGEVDSGVLELRLNQGDALPDDNCAWTAVNSLRRPKVLLVTPGNEALEMALATPRAGEMVEVSKAKPEVLMTKVHERAAAGGAFDLIIYDRCQPITMPQANTLFIGAVPPPETSSAPASNTGGTLTPALSQREREKGGATNDKGPADTWWSLGAPVVYPQIIDLDRTHPLMQWLDLGDVDIAESRPVTPPSGGTRLIDSNKGTLLAVAAREGFEDAVLGFDIYTVDKNGEAAPNTTWPIRRSFPAFVYAVLDYLGGANGVQAGETVKPGQPVTLKSDAPVGELSVRTPQGTLLAVPRGQSGLFHFNQTDELGPYEVSQGSKIVERFTVNLFDPAESDIPTAKDKSIEIGHVTVEGRAAYESGRQETWKWLLVAGLVVLLLEWYMYNRRVYV